MTPLFFGSRQQQLFGMYHPANSRNSMSHGVLLCPPVGQEHLRTYMAFRQLAIQLSSLGFDVLKFDYYGVGDSAGESEQGSIDVWIGDVKRAYQELKDMSGLQSVSIVGLRLGAALAAKAVSTGLKVKNLVLWDPVVKGHEYIRELRELTANVLNGCSDSELTHIEVLVGFPFATQNVASISNLDVSEIDLAAARNTFLILSENRHDYQELFTQLESSGRKVAKKTMNSIGIPDDPELKTRHEHETQSMIAQWSSKDEFDQALIAHVTISEISTILKKAA